MSVIAIYRQIMAIVGGFRVVFRRLMYELIKGAWRILRAATAPKKLDTATADEIFDQLRDAARRELHRKPQYPESDFTRVRDQHPNLDEAAVREMVENVAVVYQRIDDICRRRLQLKHPKKDEVEIQMNMMMIARPGPRMLENELVERLHLPVEERLQQVAAIMVDKVLGR